ncbi:MAG TPA: sugar transferase [Longimicrobium sp.]|uniref:sugar transferase n=1 Tax=Longimicrobium sp. TaxID=2029185 RepID=UPI002ED90353
MTRSFWLRGGKRAADLAAVGLTAPLWLPLLGGLAVLVRMTSGGPVLFRQRRIGRDGASFVILKLRTMDPAVAPPADGAFASFTYPADPRVTSIGRWLRRWRLDELPQLLNVLRGEMSLVGPRPETPEVTESLAARLPDYRRRLAVPPGLTGLCQVSDAYLRFRTEEELRQKLELDLRYVDSVSPLSDAAILARTLRVLARGVGVH